MKTHEIREDVRNLILDASNCLMERYGYRKTTVDDIAHEAGIGKGTIYLYFPSKEEVALSCIDRTNERIREHLAAIAGGGEPPCARAEAFLVHRVLVRFDHVQSYMRSLDDMFAALRPALLKRREQYYEDEAAILAGVLEQGKAAGRFRFDHAIETARTMIVATNALLPYNLTHEQLSQREVFKARATAIARLLLHGLIDPKHSAP